VSSTTLEPLAVPAPADRRPSLRVRAVALFVLLLIEILLGNQLATVGTPYPIGYLAAHIVLGILLIGFSGNLLVSALRAGRAATTSVAALTCLATIAAVISGFVFLLGSQSSASLLGMEAFGGIALLGSILLIVFGGAPSPAGVAPTTGSS
jgi:cation transport ATPase